MIANNEIVLILLRMLKMNRITNVIVDDENDIEEENKAADIDDVLANPKKYNSFINEEDNEYYIDHGIIRDGGNNKSVLGVILKYKNKNIIILNADNGEDYYLVNDCLGYKFPTLSFACLSK